MPLSKEDVRTYRIRVRKFKDYCCSLHFSKTSTILKIIHESNAAVTPWIKAAYEEARERKCDLKGHIEYGVQYTFTLKEVENEKRKEDVLVRLKEGTYVRRKEDVMHGTAHHVSGAKEKIEHPSLFFYLCMLQIAERLDHIHHQEGVAIDNFEYLSVVLTFA